MPIYAPSLPPRPDLAQGDHPILVLARFDLRRILSQRLGRFFGFVFAVLFLVKLAIVWAKHIANSGAGGEGMRALADQALGKGADFQSSLLVVAWVLPCFLWLHVAILGGGLISRDTLHRTRPLMFAHPMTPNHYLAAKGLLALGLPLAIQLPFIFAPWAVSLMAAGPQGPVWPIAPLLLLPAALINAILMGSVALGASALASSPRAGFSWVLGILLGSMAVAGVLNGVFGTRQWMALSPFFLTGAWPDLTCGMASPFLDWIPAVAGTLGHTALWLAIARVRTRPSEVLA